MLYVSLLKTRGNEFSLRSDQEKVELPPASHVRLAVNDSEAKLAVLDGTLRGAVGGTAGGASGAMDVSKNKTISFNLKGQDSSRP